MTAKELYEYALDQATQLVMQVRPEHLDLPTPDTEWRVRELLNHMLYELAWVPDMVAGRSVTDVGDKYDTNLLGEDMARSWQVYESLAHQAVAAADVLATAHLSYGDTSVGDYLIEAGNDQLIHAWDLGQALGVAVIFDELVAQELYDRALTQKEALAASGLYSKPLNVPESASTQAKLLAILGRPETWAKA